MKSRNFVLSLWLVALTAILGQTDAQAAPAYPIIGYFKNTYYYNILETDFPRTNKGCAIRTPSNHVLAWVNCVYKRRLDIEGTGKLADGRVVNFAEYRDGKRYYKITPHPHGEGTGSCALNPFHTIAVDPGKIPLGSLVYIDETFGMRLPDGTIHDGYWRAEDTGSAIQGYRIDIFVGDGESNGRVLSEHGISHLEALTIRLVSYPAADSCAH